MITGRDIVCVSFGAWDDMVETPQCLMTRLAKHNRVLFIDMPVSPVEFFRGMRSPGAVAAKLKQWRRGYRQVEENLWVAAPPPILPKRTNRYVNRVNALILRRWIASQARSLGFERPIFWNFQPRFPTLGRGLHPAASVYYCVDDFAAAPYAWNSEREVRALEANVCRESDLVICTGRNLVEGRKHLNEKTYFVPEAADIEMFAQAMLPEITAPKEIADLPGKIIGYTGLINWRVDLPLMVHLATRHPEWSFAMIGPLKEDSDMSALTTLPNVHLFGRKPVTDLPGYLKAMDVCLLPYVLNEYTHHVFPLKLYEYMAAGKPIVSTDMFEMRAYVGDDLQIGRSPEEFEQHILEALTDSTDERCAARSDRARVHTWEHRLDEVSSLLAPLLKDAPSARRSAPDASAAEAAR